MKRLANRIALITGAASGIGRATALALADAGCALALVDIDETGLAATKALIAADHPQLQVACFCTDVADGDAVDDLADQVIDTFGALHILVNNAGINITASFEEHSRRDFERTFAVNLWGVIHGCQAFLPHLRRVDEAHIVNISSLFGIVGVAGQSAYSASKFAVRGLSETLHEELRQTAIGVSVVHPGCIATNIVNDARIADAEVAAKARRHFADKGCAPAVVADHIVDAIQSDRHRVLVTAETHLGDWARRLLPTAGNRLFNAVIRRFMGTDPFR